MKTKYLMILVSAALLVSGCIKEKSELPGRTTLKARLEATGTRVSIGNYDGKLTWNEGDEIAVHVGNAYQDVTIDPTSEELSITETETNYRNYYAVYPASVAVAGDYGNPDLKVTLPDSYDISDIVAGTATTKTTDFAPLPMVASNDRDNSILYFYHVGGLLRVTLDGVMPQTKYVRITFDKDVTGTYTVADPETDHPTITTAGTATNNVVTFTLTDRNNLPQSLADGTIILNVPVPCGSYAWVKVECLNSSNTVIASKTYDEKTRTFQRHHGKRLSDNNMAFTFSIGSITGGSVQYTGGTVNMGSFRSYKWKNSDYSTMEPVPFTLEYSEDGGTTWTTTPPSWMPMDGTIDLNGMTSSVPLKYLVAHQNPINNNDPHHEELIKEERAKTDFFDLSTINVATGATVSRTTANCYVVQGYGSYKFPLVYGNGVVGGAVNESAFRGRDGVDGSYRPDNPDPETYHLGHFKDHLDQIITSPYITTQQADKTLTATLLWTDEPGLVTDVALEGSGEDAYITFKVPKETITQGNALVAVLADGVIAWSWHIWVTEENLTTVVEGSPGNWFAPVNLGWCESRTVIYPQRTCKVRATQSISGKSVQGTLTQRDYEDRLGANNTYYQWGRKDPMMAGDGSKGKTYYTSSNDYTFAKRTTWAASIGDAVQHPYRLYQYGTGNTFTGPIYANLWNSTHNLSYTSDPNQEEYITKTIYDPSPVGYKVPDRHAWSIFTTNNFTLTEKYGVKGREWNGVFFPMMGSRNRIYNNTADNWINDYNKNGSYFSANGRGGAGSKSTVPGFSLLFSDRSVSNGNTVVHNSVAQPIRPVKE